MNLTPKAVFAVLFWMVAYNKMLSAQDVLERTIELDEIVIEQSRIQEYAVGHNNFFPDSATLQLARAGNLAEMMKNHGFGHIRTYGPGGPALPSFRGTGSSQTAILWNGINIQSPLSGQQDLSQIPIGFIDAMQFQMGGSASLFGNGAIGGAIHLNNQSRFNEGIKIGTYQNLGSFGQYYQDYLLNWSGRKFYSSTRYFHSKAANDFSYKNKYVNPPADETRENSAVKRHGLLHENNLQLGSRHLLGVKFWYQYNHTEVPNPVSVNRSAEATQEDEFYRGILSWNYDAPDFNYMLQSAYLWHNLDFSDPDLNIYGSNLFKSMINRFELNYTALSDFDFTGGVNYTLERAAVVDFGDNNPDRNRLAVFGAVKYNFSNQKVTGVFSMREEWVDSEITPIIPSLGLEAKLRPSLKLSSHVSRNYRIPTFNDLYWSGARAMGNPDLDPELSWSEEVGIIFDPDFKVGKSNGNLNAGLTVFSSQVDDWILWLPVTVDTWSPLNIKKVWTRGIESTLGADYKIGNVELELILRYSYTKVTNERIDDGGNQSELGNQLPYTPLHEGSVTSYVAWKMWNFNAVYNYTGKQYTDGGNTEVFALQQYGIFNISLNRNFCFHSLTGHVLFQANNLFNQQFENRIGYPMPGRNYNIGIQVLFNKKNKK